MLLQQGKSISTGEYMAHRSATDAEIFFVINPSKNNISKTFSFPIKGCKPELWDAVDGSIKDALTWEESNTGTFVNLSLETNHSVFVVFPIEKSITYSTIKEANIEVNNEKIKILDQNWKVAFMPKLRKPFDVSLIIY